MELAVIALLAVIGALYYQGAEQQKTITEQFQELREYKAAEWKSFDATNPFPTDDQLAVIARHGYFLHDCDESIKERARELLRHQLYILLPHPLNKS